MAGFVQLMEFDTDRIEDVEAQARRMAEERGSDLLARRTVVGEDRTVAGTT